MPITLQEEASGKVLRADLSGKLEKKDYERFAPEVDRLVREEGRIRILVRMRDFHGWTLGGLWEDIKFDWKHGSDIERVALVGEKKWESGMASFCKPFTKASIRYFDQAQLAEAETWINEGLTQAASS
ncbi:MAG: STAS/SEC14 domain-containing protein [Planctomycetaceae bacterium]